MEEFNVIAIIVAGIIATFIKGTFIFFFGLITKTNIQPVYLLGTLATNETTKNGKLSNSRKAFFTGLAIYYGLGVLVSFVYVWLWIMKISDANLVNVFIFGFFTGVISLIGINILLNNHNKPPKIRIADHFSPVLIGNVVFSINFFYMYIQLIS